MNRIYKVVRRALSGEAVVVSELAKSRVKGGGSQKAESIATDTVRRGILFKTGVALLMAACGSTVLAQQQVYDDSGTVSLETAGSVGSGLPVWTGIPAADQGLVYRSGGSTVVTGADLVIDYSTAPVPKFVIGGFAKDGSEVTLNTVHLKRGGVLGSVYGGLSHQTGITADADQSGNPVAVQDNAADTKISWTGKSAGVTYNTVNVGDEVAVTGDVYGGHATIWGQTGNARAGRVDATSTVGAGAFAYAVASVDASSSTVTASGNIVTMGEGSSVGGNLYGGLASVNAQSADATAGNADATSPNAHAYAGASTYAYVNDSTVTVSGNNVTMGEGSSVGGNPVWVAWRV